MLQNQKKTERVQLRVTPYLYSFLKGLRAQYGIHISSYIHQLIQESPRYRRYQHTLGASNG